MTEALHSWKAWLLLALSVGLVVGLVDAIVPGGWEISGLAAQRPNQTPVDSLTASILALRHHRFACI